MLVLTRRINESIVIDGNITVTLLGILWFAMGFAVAFALYMRVREEQKVVAKSEVYKNDRHPDIKSHIVK